MALILDQRFAREAEAVFDFDLDTALTAVQRTIPYGELTVERPTRSKLVTREYIDPFQKKNEKKIRKAAKRQSGKAAKRQSGKAPGVHATRCARERAA